VFLEISRLNGCDYCMAAHSMIGEKKSGLDDATLAALRDGRSLPDATLDALATFTRHMHETRGLPTKAGVAAFKDAGYTDRHIYEIILAQAVKTLSNYANHLQHTPLDDVFAGHKWPEAA